MSWPFNVDNGMSVAAIDLASGKVVGVFTAKDHDPYLGCCAAITLFFTYWIIIFSYPELEITLKFLDALKTALTKEHKEIRSSKSLPS